MNDEAAEEPTPENQLKTAHDEQTNKVFVIKPETKWATFVASISALYLIGALAFLLWLLFDTWSGRNQLLYRFGYGKDLFDRESFRLMAFVAIAGALGATVDGIRSIVSWHSERQAYGPRFIWKDLSLPFIGAALGLIVYVTVRGGVGVFNGNFSLDQSGGTPKVTAFAVSALAGFSCWQVFRWLDSKANQLFSVVKDATTTAAEKAKVPDLSGKTVDEATVVLTSLKLKLGATHKEANVAQLGKVTQQTPAPGSMVASGDSVDITIGARTA
jgi:hypothetical protein